MTEILESWGLFEPVVVLPLLAIAVAAPIAGVVLYRRAQWKRREQERMRREMEGEGASAFHTRPNEEAEGEAEACRGEHDAAQLAETSPHRHTLRQGRDGVREDKQTYYPIDRQALF